MVVLCCFVVWGMGLEHSNVANHFFIKEALDFDGFYQRPAHGLVMLDVVAVSWIFLLYRCIPHCQVPAGWSSLHTNRGFDGLGAPISVDKYTVAMTHWLLPHVVPQIAELMTLNDRIRGRAVVFKSSLCVLPIVVWMPEMIVFCVLPLRVGSIPVFLFIAKAIPCSFFVGHVTIFIGQVSNDVPISGGYLNPHLVITNFSM